ncbi:MULTISPECIES: energy-coupling factor transporter transmembrane component T family protein [Paenibacillus]|uniref:Cobalt ECF transporter T component CbiQ n=1 Tax=Paenibacillus validus TaxID=44253 RepID=A0A7X2Z8S6_9BACL|nr:MULTISPECIES: energy-coupling factor transporter transmembrane component T [Paenibacillus]MUG70440.1 hypothetical protein [Paenibacillus validus]
MKTIVRYPPLRIAATLLCIVMAVSMNRLDILGALLVWGQLYLIMTNVPLRSFWGRARLIVPFVLFSFLFFPLYESGTGIALGNGLTLSAAGAEKAAVYAARLLFTVQALTVCFHELPLPSFFQALLRLKVPGIFIELILFTLRFTLVIRDEAFRMMQARRSRGLRLRAYFNYRQTLELARLLGLLLQRSLQRSERIYWGMMSRGYRGVPAQSPLPAYRSADGALAALATVPVALLFLADKLWKEIG